MSYGFQFHVGEEFVQEFSILNAYISMDDDHFLISNVHNMKWYTASSTNTQKNKFQRHPYFSNKFQINL